MRSTLCALSVRRSVTLLAICSSLANAFSADLDGRWRLDVVRFGEEKLYFVELVQDGTTVSGTWRSPRTGEYPFDGGTYEDGKLTFDVDRKREGDDRVYGLRLTEKGDLFEGRFLYNGEDAGPVVMRREGNSAVGKWNAVAVSPDGNEHRSILEVSEAEGRLRGTSIGEAGSIEVRDLEADGERFGFAITIPIQGQDVVFVIRGGFESPDALVGKWSVEGADLTGAWRATREAVAVTEAEAVADADPPAPADPAVVEALPGRWYGTMRPEGDQAARGGEKVNLEVRLAEGKLQGEVHHGEHVAATSEITVSGRRVTFSVGAEERRASVVAELGGDGVLRGTVTHEGNDAKLRVELREAVRL